MQQLTERQRIDVAVIWALALVLIYVLVLSPLFAAERMALLACRDAARLQTMRTEMYQRDVLADPQAEEKLRMRQARGAAALPEERGQAAFLNRTEEYARRAGVRIEGVVPHAPAAEENLVVLPIEIVFRGGYFEVLSFLRAVQEGERAVQFGAFRLTADGDALRCAATLHIAALAAENYGGEESDDARKGKKQRRE